jgi:predicted phage tail protein
MTIYGGGGGGGKGGGGSRSGPSTAKDNLDSTSYANIIELLSEGEIEGFATPSKLGLTRNTAEYNNASLKDIFLNDTSILRSGADISGTPPDSDYNFRDVTVITRFGEQDQAYVPGFGPIENATSVGAPLEDAGDQSTIEITDPEVDAVRVTIDVPQLQQITDAGDIIGAEIELTIAVAYNGGSYTTDADTTGFIRDRIVGRTSDLYQRDYIINLTWPAPPTGVTQSASIRVTRVTPISFDDTRLSNFFSLSSYGAINYEKLRYPNSAYVALRVDAEQFNSIPSRTYRIRGIKVAIPSNATVDITNGRLIYSGVWNGTFSFAQWCSDPAWILWDLLTSTRYGLGDHIQPATLDKWAFYRASQYCSELVPTGLSATGVEPRFSCNVNIQTAEEAYKLINDLCSVFRAMPFWNIGSISVMQDRPADPVALFTLANVTENGFSYEGSSIKTRATVAIVGWLNLDIKDIDREIVEDIDGISKYGVITKEVSAFACTSRAQAHRIGEWLLYSEKYETEICSFVTGIENGVLLRPGSIIEIADPVKSGQRRAGRISSATTTAITVDNIGDVTAGQLSVVLPDGIVETRSISGIAGRVITVSPAFSAAPSANAAWLCDGNNVAPTQWRVLGVQEQDGINFAITAIAYNASKYAYIERGSALESRPISVLNIPPDSPIGLKTEEVLYEANGRVATKLSLTWKPVRGINEYRVRWRNDFTNWSERRVYGPVYEIEDVTQGVYNIEVSSISATQVISSTPATWTVTVAGVTARPANVTGVSLVPINESSAIIQWNLATDLDVLIGGEVLIRHDPRAPSAAEWNSSNAIVQAAAGSQTQKQVPLLDGTYFIAFRDQSGQRSLVPSGIPAVLPTPQPRLVVKTWTENPTFSGGTNINLPYNASKGGLFLNSASGLTGERIYADTLDLGQVYDVNIRRRIVSRSETASGVFFDGVGGNFEAQPGQFDGDDLDQTNAITYVRTTLTDPAATPAWSDWNEYANAIVRARGIQLKVVATTATNQVGMIISELGATAELQQRTESGNGTAASTYNIVFASAFYAAPQVTISPLNMATGDYFAVSGVTRTGFTVAFTNSVAVAVIRNFSYTAVGYGKEV